MYRIFLGGTCNGSKWRDEFEKRLEIDYFNPVVENWTPECMKEELHQREICHYCLYFITPKMTGTYSIAEAVEDSIKRPEKTIFCYVVEDEASQFDTHAIKSLDAVGAMIERNGGRFFKTFNECINFINGVEGC